MRKFSDQARELGVRLGIGDIGSPPPCHGYANCCSCAECDEREKHPVKAGEPVRQPWEVDKQRAA